MRQPAIHVVFAALALAFGTPEHEALSGRLSHSDPHCRAIAAAMPGWNRLAALDRLLLLCEPVTKSRALGSVNVAINGGILRTHQQARFVPGPPKCFWLATKSGLPKNPLVYGAGILFSTATRGALAR